LHGSDTVVTGTLPGGRFQRGQSVAVQPGNSRARIRAVQNHGRDSQFARPGRRTAINLPDLPLGSDSGAIKRGQVVTMEGLEASSTVDVLLERSLRVRPQEPAARPIKNGGSFYLHHGTARVAAKVIFLDCDALRRGEKAIAQLRLDSPVLAFLGDRFVVRDASEQHTVAGGIVLDGDGDPKTFRAAAQRQLLAARAVATNDVEICVSSEIERRGPVRLPALLRKSRFSRDEIASALQRLRERSAIVFCGELAADTRAWQSLRTRASGLIDDAHKNSSDRPGVEVKELRAAFHDQPSEVFEALLSDLCTNGYIRVGSIIGRSSHRAELPPDLKIVAQQIVSTLSEKAVDPPSRNDLVRHPDAQKTLRFLLQQGQLIEISPDVVLLRENYERMKSAIVDFISKNGEATVSELRQQLHTSRRVMVPLLEKLDREGVTQRVADRRRLK
jgi:selenocysteine-specific elongation factor